MLRSLYGFIILLVLAVLVPISTAGTAVTPAQRCTAVKVDAAARAVVAHVACEARAVEKSTAVRADCHAAADRRLHTAFTRIEARGGCSFVDDAEAVDTAIDGLVDGLVAGATTGRCGATKLRTAAQKVFGDLACHRVAARHGTTPTAACQEKASTRFLAAFARAEKRLTCGTTGDAPTVQAKVDAFVTETVARLIAGTAAIDPTPKNLAATIVGGEVQLQWTAPQPASGKTHVRVLRRLNTAPVDADDALAAVVFFGTASAATDALTALLPTTTTDARTYHYAAFGCTAAGACESVGSRTTVAPTLVEALRAGGYVLHWRHAAATVCADQTALGTAATTASPDWWKSCDAQCGTATARQLDATGVAQATTIGQAFDTLAIPVGRVVSSEFCRNRTTAELMDFGPTTELRQDITFFVYAESGRCDASYALIDQVPAAGTNTAIIGHAGFGGSCPVLADLAWGEAAIFKPDGVGGSVLIARVLSDGWAAFE